MFELNTAYSDLVDLRRAAAAVHEIVSDTTREELEAARWTFECRVKIAMLALPEDEFPAAMAGLSDEARAEIEEMRLKD